MRRSGPGNGRAEPLFGAGALPFLIVGYIAAEFFLFTTLAGRIGFIATFLLALAKSLIGMALLSTVLRQTLQTLSRRGGGLLQLSGGQLGRTLLGALLLVVPGFVSGLIGLWLLIPRGGWRAGGHREPDGVIELTESEWREVREQRLPGQRPHPGRPGAH